jgi:Fe2+ transport system protein B
MHSQSVTKINEFVQKQIELLSKKDRSIVDEFISNAGKEINEMGESKLLEAVRAAQAANNNTTLSTIEQEKLIEYLNNYDKSNKFVSSSDSIIDLCTQLFEKIFKEVMQFLNAMPVQGHFDDLVGQRMFLEVILLVMCGLVFLLFIIFIFNLIYLLNIEKISKLFNNKFISFYFKYQNFLSKITLYYIPFFIGLGLLTIFQGLHWLITHQIPFEALNIDLHQFVSSESKDKLLLFILGTKNCKGFINHRKPSSLYSTDVKHTGDLDFFLDKGNNKVKKKFFFGLFGLFGLKK